MRASAIVTMLFVAGCASSARNMMPVNPPQRLMPPPGQALVVFVRPSKFAWAVTANLLDETGRYLGDAPAQGHFAAVLPPGRHLLVIWAENTDGLDAELAPGRIYFVEVAATMGAWSAQMHLRAIKPPLDNFAHRDEWMLGTTQYAVASTEAQEKLNQRVGDVQERIRRAREHLEKYSAEEREQHILRAGDGL
jgi:hypothetical protein